jgi:hypothetical protein
MQGEAALSSLRPSELIDKIACPAYIPVCPVTL